MAPLPPDPQLAALSELLRAEPPAFLNELVKARLSDVLADRREELRASAAGEAARTLDTPPRPIGSIEALGYACGFLAAGAQLVDGLARILWRAMLG